jgi:hypothetical protein
MDAVATGFWFADEIRKRGVQTTGEMLSRMSMELPDSDDGEMF